MKSTTKTLIKIVPLLFSAWVAAEQPVDLKDIAFSALPGGRFEVRMGFSAQPPEPKGYTIDKPARVVLDFPNVESKLKEKKYPLSLGSAKSANVLTDGGRTRLILNMAELENYQTKIDGNNLIMTVGNSGAGQDVMRKATTLADRISTDVANTGRSVSNIDFRRGEDGEGKVIISLSDPSVSVNVENVGGQINLSFADTQLPVSLRRKLDVTDFATPVTAISSDYNGSNTVVTVKPTGEYDYLAYQTDNEYVLSVKKLTAQQVEERKSKFNYVGEKLSLNFQDIPVRSVLQLIADFTELNLVASDTVDGKITLRLENVPWDQALDLVLKTKGLDKRQVGNVLMVAPAAEIAAREREELNTKKQLQELAPLRTEFVQVLYADAGEIFKLFGKTGKKDAKSDKGEAGATASILSERGSVIVDTRTNSLIITETEDKIQQFRELVKRIDIPVRQVSIEARIVKASASFSKDIGVSWAVSQGHQGKHYFTGMNGNDPSISVQGQDRDVMAVDMGVPGRTSNLTLGLLDNNSSNLLALTLSALEDSGQGEIVSQPKVITGDKQKALIKSGKQIPYQEATSSGATTTAFKDVVLQLEVTPQITPDDHIIMSVELKKDAIDGLAPNGVLQLSTMGLNSRVLVENGQTLVLGGVFEDEENTNVSKVPFLGDLPVVGSLFRRTTSKSDKTELLIFITPRLLQDPLATKRG